MASSPVISAVRSVRGRATLFSVVVIAAALVASLALVLFLYWNQLSRTVDQALTQQVADRARLLDGGSDPDSLTSILSEEAFVWIGTPDGAALAVGGSLRVLESPVPGSIGGISAVEVDVIEEDYDEDEADETSSERVTMRVASAASADGRIVVAGSPQETITENVTRLIGLFAWLVPLLALLTGLVTWFVAGRVLRPVDAMRLQAEEISGRSLDARVPVPDTRDEVHDLAVTMNAMLDRIERHDQVLREFTADASHELKSPIANLRALLDTAQIADTDWPATRHRLAGETSRLNLLVDDLLLLASRDACVESPFQRVGLDDLLFDEAELVAATSAVTVDLGAVEPVAIEGDPVALTRLVRNLVDNAVRHARTRIALQVHTEHACAVLRVSDDGPGIAEADRERVFERFARLDEGRGRNDGGTGLGLAIARSVGRDHDATVTVEDGPLSGATFVVRFPEKRTIQPD